MKQQDLFIVIPGQKSLCIDNTTLSPSEVAQQIITHYSLPKSSILAAMHTCEPKAARMHVEMAQAGIPAARFFGAKEQSRPDQPPFPA